MYTIYTPSNNLIYKSNEKTKNNFFKYSKSGTVKTNQYKQAQFKDECKLAAHAVLEMFCFCLRHLSTGEVKYFLTAARNKTTKASYTTYMNNPNLWLGDNSRNHIYLLSLFGT